MADETGQQALALKNQLLSEGSGYDFFQAYRLLNLLNTVENTTHEIHARPNLSLAFPETDISKIRQLPDKSYQITANFMGLYGVSSPLPTFYTEDLLEEFRQDYHAQRDLFDLINRTIYPLLIKAWLKSKPLTAYYETNQSSLLHILFSFLGIKQPEVYSQQPGMADLIHFAGLYSAYPKSALGLQTILSGAFSNAKVNVIQCALKVVPIPVNQHCEIGSNCATLGVDGHLGSQIRDRNNNIIIELSEISESFFRMCMPGNFQYRRLEFLVRYYLVDPLNVTLRLVLSKGEANGVTLGSESWGRLALDSWLSPQSNTVHEVNYSI